MLIFERYCKSYTIHILLAGVATNISNILVAEMLLLCFIPKFRYITLTTGLWKNNHMLHSIRFSVNHCNLIGSQISVEEAEFSGYLSCSFNKCTGKCTYFYRSYLYFNFKPIHTRELPLVSNTF